MTTTEIETRLTALEQKVADLVMQGPAAGQRNWIFEMWGHFAGDEDFVKAMALGRKWRERENRKSLRTAKSRHSRKPRT